MNYKSIFLFLKADYLQLWFLHKNDLRISLAGKPKEIIRFSSRKPSKSTTLSFRFKASEVPLWIWLVIFAWRVLKLIKVHRIVLFSLFKLKLVFSNCVHVYWLLYSVYNLLYTVLTYYSPSHFTKKRWAYIHKGVFFMNKHVLCWRKKITNRAGVFIFWLLTRIRPESSIKSFVS